jgi:hypothetical protein
VSTAKAAGARQWTAAGGGIDRGVYLRIMYFLGCSEVPAMHGTLAEDVPVEDGSLAALLGGMPLGG